ncbi:hypothetical protein GCM10027299_45170 [Larkinella ripae]
MISPSIRRIALVGAILGLISTGEAMAQPGYKPVKPNVTYNTYGAISIKTQSPPAFPGGDGELAEFIRESVQDTEKPIKLGRKTWLTATIDGSGKVTKLVPSTDRDPTLKKEIARIGALMPRWKPGLINDKGVETFYEFLVRR